MKYYPYLKENNIKTLVHLGDVVDRRKFINFKTVHTFREEFMFIVYIKKVLIHISYFLTTTILIIKIQIK